MPSKRDTLNTLTTLNMLNTLKGYQTNCVKIFKKKKQVHQMEMIVRHLWSIVVCLNSVDF